MIYKNFIKPLLFKFDPEHIHEIIAKTLALTGRPLKPILKTFCKYQHPALQAKFFNQHFNNPIGIAAGFDKNGRMIQAIEGFGFGFMEVGTITPKPQEGNEKPRLFRLPKDHAVINRMGFNNHGLKYLKKNLQHRGKTFPIGANIGKNKVTPNENAASDYLKCFTELYDIADFFIVNVSSPNTPNLRELQDKEPLTKLLQKIQHQNTAHKPIFLKIAPDLTPEQLDDIVEIILTTKITGCIATNTTINRTHLKTSFEEVDAMGAGGLSGQPLKTQALQVVSHLYQKSQGKFLIIGTGGIETAQDAINLIRAGANLLEIYTGFIYEGPMIARKINKGIAKECQKHGLRNYQEMIGQDLMNKS